MKDGLDNGKTYIDGMQQLLQKSGLKGWQKDFDALARELKAHDEWVKSTVLPRARKDESAAGGNLCGQSEGLRRRGGPARGHAERHDRVSAGA